MNGRSCHRIDVVLLGVILTILVAGVVLVGLASSAAPSGRVFIGVPTPWPEDASYHLGWAEQARQGDLLFEDKWNGATPRTRLVFNWYFLLLGRLARTFGTGTAVAWAALQPLWIVLIPSLLWTWLGPLTTSLAERRVALVLAVFGGGIGWVALLPVGWSPAPRLIDVDSVETLVANWLVREVVIPPTVAVTLGTLLLARRLDTGGGRVRGGLCALLLLLAYVHPHDCLPVVLTVSALRLLSSAPRRRAWGDVALFAATLLGPAFHYGVVLAVDSHLWGYVNLRDRYGPLDLFLGFPFLWAVLAGGLALAGGSSLRRIQEPLIWLGVCGALLVTPVVLGNQHYLLHGVQIPLAAATVGAAGPPFRRWREGSRSARPRLALSLFLVASVTTALGIWVADGVRVVRGRAAWYYPAALDTAFEKLRRMARSHDVALGSLDVAHHLVRYTGLRVYAAMPEQTVDFERRRDEVVGFLAGASAERDLPARAAARWVVIGGARVPAESAGLAGGQRLEPRLVLPEVRVYEVVQ